MGGGGWGAHFQYEVGGMHKVSVRLLPGPQRWVTDDFWLWGMGRLHSQRLDHQPLLSEPLRKLPQIKSKVEDLGAGGVVIGGPGSGDLKSQDEKCMQWRGCLLEDALLRPLSIRAESLGGRSFPSQALR